MVYHIMIHIIISNNNSINHLDNSINLHLNILIHLDKDKDMAMDKVKGIMGVITVVII